MENRNCLIDNLLIFNPSNIDKWEKFVVLLINFLQQYQILINSYVLDFFVCDLYKEINSNWRKSLKIFTTEELSLFINYSEKFSYLPKKDVLPLSLLAFRASCRTFSLPRKPIKNASNLVEFLQKTKKFSRLGDGSLNQDESELPLLMDDVKYMKNEWVDPSKELSPNGGQHSLLHHVFRKHLKPKKQHEVVRLAQIVAMAKKETNSKAVVDVGSGQGHLSRLISYGYQIPTICLDNQPEFINGARKFDLQLEASLKRNDDDLLLSPTQGPKHTNCHLQQETSNQQINQILKTAWPDIFNEEEVGFGLMGLHSCGDLGANLFKLFSTMKNCRSVISVGCCYMKLTEQSNATNIKEIGYPLSEKVRNQTNHSLSYVSREMSCHALEAYANKLKDGADNLKVHCYRAVLEKLIVSKNKKLAHSGLRSVKNAHLMAFKKYGCGAISKLEGIHFEDEELDTEEVQNNLEMWMEKTVIFDD